jgi:hypothetical protein
VSHDRHSDISHIIPDGVEKERNRLAWSTFWEALGNFWSETERDALQDFISIPTNNKRNLIPLDTRRVASTVAVRLLDHKFDLVSTEMQQLKTSMDITFPTKEFVHSRTIRPSWPSTTCETCPGVCSTIRPAFRNTPTMSLSLTRSSLILCP